MFREDEKPWITYSAQGMLAVLILRRIAYSMLTLFRSVTQRSETKRATPWRDILRTFYNVVIAATDDCITTLRPRLAFD